LRTVGFYGGLLRSSSLNVSAVRRIAPLPLEDVRVCVSVCVFARTVFVFCALKWAGRARDETLCLRGPVTSPRGSEGWNLRGVTVINSPFNNSCPTWSAGPSQCPLCIYAYVYLCIHSKQGNHHLRATITLLFVVVVVVVVVREGGGGV